MNAKRLSVLWLAPFVPYPPRHGGAVRIFNLIRRLGRELDIDLCTLSDGPAPAADLDALREHCRSVQVFARNTRLHPWPPRLAPPAVYLDDVRAMRQAVAARQSAGRADILQIDYPSLATYLDFRRDSRTCLTEHDVSFLSQYRRFQAAAGVAGKVRGLLAAGTFFYYERRHLPRFDAVIAMSEFDRRMLQRFIPGLPLTVVPNGVDCEYYVPQPAVPAGDPALLYAGNFGHPPNVDAMLWFARAIWPALAARLPNLRCFVVGRPAPEIAALASDRIIVTGSVPDLRPYYAQAAAVVVPIRVGSGTRLKILEAFAAGVPVVSTTLGAEGIPAQPERELLIADTPQAFVDQTTRLLADRDLAESIRRRARGLAETAYDWKILAGRQMALYEKLAKDMR